MRSRRMMASVAAGAMMLAGMAVVGAPAALAANTNPAILYVPKVGAGAGDCGNTGAPFFFRGGAGNTGAQYTTSSGIQGNAGDLLTISNECTIDINVSPGGGSLVLIPGGQSVQITLAGTNDLIAFEATGAQSTVAETTITGTSPGPNPGPPQPSGSTDASGAPAPVIQQFGLPSSGNCEDGATEAMNLSGVSSGGWGISWAQWMNDQRGGAVCSRTLMYDTTLAKWVVN